MTDAKYLSAREALMERYPRFKVSRPQGGAVVARAIPGITSADGTKPRGGDWV
jgi:hypothetical protein